MGGATMHKVCSRAFGVLLPPEKYGGVICTP